MNTFKNGRCDPYSRIQCIIDDCQEEMRRCKLPSHLKSMHRDYKDMQKFFGVKNLKL